MVGEQRRVTRGNLIAEVGRVLWPNSLGCDYTTLRSIDSQVKESVDEVERLSSVRSDYREIEKLLSLVGERALSFDFYLGQVAGQSKRLLDVTDPQVTQDIERFRQAKDLIDKAEHLHEEAKKIHNKLTKHSHRTSAASLVKQAQERLPELEETLSQRYPEVKATVMSWIGNELRYLEYALERFLKVAISQVSGVPSNGSQGNLEGFLVNEPDGDME